LEALVRRQAQEFGCAIHYSRAARDNGPTITEGTVATAPPQAGIVGVILAGGRSRRMAGTDKALLPLAGRPLIAHVVARLAPQVEHLIVNANGDPARFAEFGLPVVPDATDDFAGPLAGILAGMTYAARTWPRARWVATMPADTPFFPPDLVARLRAATDSRTVAVATSADTQHHVVALLPLVLRVELAARLARSEDRSVGRWLATQSTAAVDFPEAAPGVDPFFNVNTPDDLARAEALVARFNLTPGRA
jgi:molybdopterin-guanine dinucleotide biosynthesis protein A